VSRKRRTAAQQSGAVPSTAAPPRALAHPAWIALALTLLNVFVYAAVAHFQLVNWDDPGYVTENPIVLGGLSWDSARWALTTGHSPYWHPLTWLSHLLDVTLFAGDAGMYHVTNLVLHTANTILVFELFRRTTGRTGRSAFVAAVFAAHPLHVESVAWIAERKDVLSTFFWLLTILGYVRFARRPGARWYVAVIVLFALALMSKPMVVTLPIVLLLFDVWPLKRAGFHITEKVPLFALALATSVATVMVQHRIGAMAGLDALPWPARLANALIGYVAYVWATLWPAGLAPFYPLFTISAARVTGAALLLAGACAAAVVLRQRYPYIVVGWFWYVVTIAPVIGVLQAGEQGMADRFMYVPMIGLLVIAAWGVPELGARLAPGGRRLIPAAAIAVVLACALTARAQVAHWEDSLTLWEHAVRVTPESHIAHENLGQALRDLGRFDEAKASYERALVHAPAGFQGYLAVIHNSLGMVLTRQGKTTEALPHFEDAARFDPAFAEAQNNLGNALAAEGRAADALAHYDTAIRLKPDYIEPRVGLGSALLSQRRAAEAIPHYREALRLDPNLAQAHNGLGAALAMEGHTEQAMAEYAEALRLKPDLATGHFNLALLLINKGEVGEGRRHLETALAIDPQYQPAQQALRAIARER